MNRAALTATLALALILTAAPAAGQAPPMLPVQGYLTTTDGAPVDGNEHLTFALYDAASGDEALWSETVGVTVSQGSFAAMLGGETPIDLAVFRDRAAVWLGVSVGGDPELGRVRLLTAPYAAFAAHAGDAATLAGKPASEYATTSGVETAARAVCYDTEAELKEALDDDYRPASWTPSWNDLADIPPGFQDGVDDGDAVTPGPGLTADGGTLSIDATGCSPGDVLSWDTTDWICKADEAGLGGAGTEGYLARFDAEGDVSDSTIVESGGQLGVGLTVPEATVHVAGDVRATAVLVDPTDGDGWVPTRSAQVFTLTGEEEYIVSPMQPKKGYGIIRPLVFDVSCAPGGYQYVSSKIWLGRLYALSGPGANSGGPKGQLVFRYAELIGHVSGEAEEVNAPPLAEATIRSTGDGGEDIVITVGDTDPTLGNVNGFVLTWRDADDMLLIKHAGNTTASGNDRLGRCFIQRVQ